MDYKQAYEKFTADAKKSQDIKVGDKVRYTGKSKRDMTHGRVYEVVGVQYGYTVNVYDDVGDLNAIHRNECEPVTDAPQSVPDTPDYNTIDGEPDPASIKMERMRD